MKKKNKFYTVWAGRKIGVYSSWEECKKQIHGFENAIYKGFSTFEHAKKAFLEDSDLHIGSNSFEPTLSAKEMNVFGRPILDSICVDGAWNTQTNIIEYQGVNYSNKQLIFHAGPFGAGTNNIAEFLAIVHALTYCKNNQLSSVIYSDSRTAILWVQKKKPPQKLNKLN